MTTRPVVAIALGGLLALAQAANAQIVSPAPQPEPLPAPLEATFPDISLDRGHHLSSDLIGQTVYSSAAADAAQIGDINDLVVADDGEILAAVVGVGGFLGIGEKNVAVAFNSITWHMDENGGQFAVLSTTKEDLEAAPSFDVATLDPASAIQPAANQTIVVERPVVIAQAPATPTPVTPAPFAPPPDILSPPTPAPVDAPNTLDVATMSASSLMGAAVLTADNETVGNINDVLLTQDGRIDAVIVDVGGFLGLGAKPVAIAYDDLQIMNDGANGLQAHVEFTKTQLELAPGYSEAEYATQRDTMRLTTQG
jgi:sporulation protein YlmC with PRC-barrel domain